ncbi:MAG: DUF6499 domain-containing protein [Proteobacteria bacterium]|nr:DUF6499 domain-containing protein [Pseudomonadota bacterium]
MTLEQFQSAFPDWTDKSQYPDPKQFSLSQWAWEFLRRNPNYQADYAALELEANQEVQDRISLKTGLAYGLNGSMIHPRASAVVLSGQIFQNGIPRIVRTNNQPFKIQSFEVAVIIDLRLPIDDQLKFTGPALCDLQDHLHRIGKQGDVKVTRKLYKRAKPDKYSSYLRVLDAKKAGTITFRKIAEQVFPLLTNNYDPKAGENRASVAYKAAVALRDGGYRFLPLLSSSVIDD